MEPLSSAERQAMKQNGRGVTDADIDEYELLLLHRLHSHVADTHGSSLLRSATGSDSRIETLYEKLYGRKPGSPQ